MRQAVIMEARDWVDTPFHHQASLKGVGCDCAGLVKGVGEGVGLVDIEQSEWRRVSNYGRQPRPDKMGSVLARFLVPVEHAGIGDVLWMQWREGLPMHLAILAELDGRETIIHAFSDFGRVVEHGYSDEWKSRVACSWAYPGIDD